MSPTAKFSTLSALLATYPVPSKDLCLRLADPSRDIPALTELINAAYVVESGSTGEEFKRTPRWIDNDAKEHFEKPGETIVLEREGVIIGMVFVEMEGDERCLLGPFAVDPRSQGCGYGKLLLGLVEEIARVEPGVKSLALHVVNVRNTLIAFYKRQGFVDLDEEAPFPESHNWRTMRKVKFVVLEKKM